jgi:hypothetical protein
MIDYLTIVRIVGALICSTTALPAQTLNVSLTSVTPSETISGSFTGAGGFANRIAGVLDFDYADAFCVEPLQSVSGVVVYDVQSYNLLPNADSIARVLGAYQGSSKTSLEAASAQWAIWEIVGDGISNRSFRTGNTQIFFDRRTGVLRDNIERRALEYFDLSQLLSTPAASFVYATHPTSQNVVFMIPEPSSALLGVLSLSALLIRRRH